MILQFIYLQWKKATRSVSLNQNIIASLFLGFMLILLLGYLFLLGLALSSIIKEAVGVDEVVPFLNAYLIFYFLFECGYRFMLQKLPVFELENFLQLPISRSKIIHFLLGKSFISAFSIITLLLFTPFALMEVTPAYGATAAFYWLATLVFISWTLHWLMLWFKQQYGNKIVGLLIIFVLLGGGIGSAYYGWFNIGTILQPAFAASLSGPVPFLVMIGLFILAYILTFQYYRKNAYLEDLSERQTVEYANASISFLSRFGLAGEMANLEWKLILRHKKSKAYLYISAIFLLYGLLFYSGALEGGSGELPFMYIFVAVFVTGIFIMQYGQLFLSWNSSFFDFYASNAQGIKELIKGKYILLTAVSLIFFLFSIPYVYFGWQILFLHLATFLFNIGVSIHIIVHMALWKPKPMDLSKGALFNYEGVGIAQFLMGIPMLLLPYAIYIPVNLLFNWQAGLLTLALIGLFGIIFFQKFIDMAVKRVVNNKYKISASFRGEL